MSEHQQDVYRRYAEMLGQPSASADEPQSLQQPDIRQPITATTTYGSAKVLVPVTSD